MSENKNIVIYQSGEIELKVSVNNETIWLRQDEIALLFEKDRTVITRHITNVLNDKEVDEKSNVQKMHIPNSDKPVKLYSLDIVLAVGYRTNSSKWINEQNWIVGKFCWQKGFGAFTYSRSQIDAVVKYILNQPQHHKKTTFKDEYINFLKKFEIEYDERYLFEWHD